MNNKILKQRWEKVDELLSAFFTKNKKINRRIYDNIQSILDGIKGIGDSKKKELLTSFDSIDEIANASLEELTKVNGINESLAKEILKTLNGEKE